VWRSASMADDDEKKIDYGAMVAEVLPKAQAQAKGGDLSGALETLLAVEKKTRLAGEAHPTADVAVAVVTLCWEARDLDALNAHILILAKRRAQLNTPITKMTQTCMSFLDAIEDKARREELIGTLRTVTSGRIYVEVERARLTAMVSKMREAEGKVAEASEVLQEVQVETYGSMDVSEKTEFILEQMRLTLAQRDFVRTQIISRKVNKKTMLEVKGMEAQRVRYYRQMIQLHEHQKEPLLLARDWEAIYKTKTQLIDGDKAKPEEEASASATAGGAGSGDKGKDKGKGKGKGDGESKKDDGAMDAEDSAPPAKAGGTPMKSDAVLEPPEDWPEALRHVVLYLSLAPFDPEQRDFMLGLLKDARISEVPAYQALLKHLTTDLIVPWPLPEAGEIDAHLAAVPGEWAETLHKRVVQHNMRVLAKCYTRIRGARVASLLGLTEDQAETFLSEMVTEKLVYARIDRPAGIVNFQKPQAAAEVLSEWGRDITECLALVETTTHLINRENMVHGLVKEA